MVNWQKKAAVCVIMAAGGYPDAYQKGNKIEGLGQAKHDAWVFHAGTARNGQDIVTSGGRVLGVTAAAADIQQAVDKAYTAVKKIHFAGRQYRRDIAHRAIARLK